MDLERIVNNAGTATLTPSVDLTVEEWNRVIEVNLTRVFLCARTVARERMKRQHGKIINIASIYGGVGDIFTTAAYYVSREATLISRGPLPSSGLLMGSM